MLSKSTEECIKKDIVFDADTGLKADIYYGKRSQACNAQEGAPPFAKTIVFIYGGSWKTGNKNDYAFVADAFTEKGYNVVLPNYRLFPQVAYPKFVEDLDVFMVWLAANAKKYQLNTREIYLMGHSAGAYNASMYLLDEAYQKPFTLAGFIGLAGPYDFFLPSKDPEFVPIFSRRDKGFNSSSELPVSQINQSLDKILTRALLLHGAEDKVVTPKNPASLGGYLEQRGVTVSRKIYAGKGHISLISGVSKVPFFTSEVKDDVLDFIALDEPR